jgi:hypothetical protein
MSRKAILLAGIAVAASLCACSGGNSANSPGSSSAAASTSPSTTVAPPVTTSAAPTTSAPPAPTTTTLSGRVLTTFLYGDDVQSDWPTGCTGNGTTKVDIKDGAGAILYVADATANVAQVSRSVSDGVLDLECANSYTATVPPSNVYTLALEGATTSHGVTSKTVNAVDIQATGAVPDLSLILTLY